MPGIAHPDARGSPAKHLRSEGLRVPGASDHELPAVPVEAPVVEAAGRAAVRVFLPVDRLRLDEVAAEPREAEFVAPAREGDHPARWNPAEDDVPDVAGRTAARDRRGDVRPAVAREVEAEDLVDALRIDSLRDVAQHPDSDVGRTDRGAGNGRAAGGLARVRGRGGRCRREG